MKNLQNKLSTPTLALFIAGILGGLAPIAVKIVLKELPPLTISFLRLTLSLVVLVPLGISSFRHILVHWKRLILIGIFYSGNVFLFTLGIKHTTSAVSQLLYGGVPLFMLLELIKTLGSEMVCSFPFSQVTTSVKTMPPMTRLTQSDILPWLFKYLLMAFIDSPHHI